MVELPSQPVNGQGREASRPDVLELQLGHKCSNRCVFCQSAHRIQNGEAGLVPKDRVFWALAEGAAQGTTRVVLLGGEPTIHPAFFEILAEAKRLDFEEIVIFTNGVMLAHPGFLTHVLELGEFSWRVSIQGDRAEIHDAVTHQKGAFERLTKGLDLLVSNGQIITANTCVTQINVDALKGFPAIAKRYGISGWHIDPIRPEDVGDSTPARLRELLVAYTTLAAEARKILQAFLTEVPDVECTVGNLPYCLLPEWGHRVHHGGEQTIVYGTIRSKELGQPRDKYSRHFSARQKTQKCEGCVFDQRCSGIPSHYFDLYGDGELAALSLQDVAAQDSACANLPLLVRPWADRLLAEIPEPWRLEQAVPDWHRRSLNFRFSRPEGADALLDILHNDDTQRESGLQAVWINTPSCRLRISGMDHSGEDASLSHLVSYLRRQVSVIEPPLPVAEKDGVPDVTRIDVKLAFACNNRCEFCVQGNKRELHGPRPTDQIYKDLEDGRQRGADAVVFTGGEPTLQASLFDGIRLAASLGYRTIQIQSNGRIFSHRPFCEKAIAAGANEFALSLHGAQATTHEQLTRAPRSFRQVVSGIHNLTQMGQKVITNSVVTSSNYKELPALARLLVDLGVIQYQFAFVHILGTAAENSTWLVPRKSEIMPWIREGLDVGRRAGVRAMTEAIPYCFLAGYEDCVAERIIPRTKVFDANVTLDDYTTYRLTEGKVKGPNCHRCIYFEQCEGPWSEYPDQFGWDEFNPVLDSEEEVSVGG